MRFENNLTSMLSASIAIKKYKCHGKEIWNAVAAMKYAWRSITCTASMSWWLLSRSRMFFFAFPNAFTILFYLNATNSIKSTDVIVCVFFSVSFCCFFSVYYFELFCVSCCGCCIRCVPVFISVCQCALKVSTHCPYIQCRVCARACVSFSGLLAKQYTP